MEKTILFVDNTKDFLDVHTKLLELRGYQVITAMSVAEAEEKLRQFNIQLAVLDIRLEAEGDPLDISGLALAKNKQYQYLPKIILTAHPSWEYAEIALGAALEGLGVVKMVLKADGTDNILDTVDQVFAEHVPVNWSLDVHSSKSGMLLLSHLATSITPVAAEEQLSLRTAEIKELLSRLFLEHAEVYIERMVAQVSGKVWLIVSAFSQNGVEQQYLVIMGKRPLLTQELSNFDQFIPKNNLFPVVQTHGKTAHYAAYTAVLPGSTDFSNVTTLTDLYQHYPLEKLTSPVKRLFEELLAPWYQAHRSWEEKTGISQLYQFWLQNINKTETEADLAFRIQTICEQSRILGIVRLDHSPQILKLHLPKAEEGRLPNPLTALVQMQLETPEPILYGTAHGRLDGTAVLSDTQSNCWLIDYAHINRGPLLQDFVTLEAAIKYDMLVMLEFDKRYDMEQRLLAASELDDIINIKDASPEIAKAISLINIVRQQASIIGIKMEHYCLGLILHAISRLLAFQPRVRHTRHKLMPYVHALISAAMNQQLLIAPSRPDLPSQAIYSLWIDEQKQEVWVEGQTKDDLTAQEYEFLHFLYKHAGKTCSRDAILKEVYDLEYAPDMLPQQRKSFSDPRINSAISRLREKIEPDRANPKYILSVWGSGYKLKLET
ncbi:winged helix-turn-helix domain-containing protein [Candidatus Leptofilum sp.]|uniref:winged helix-turn-helix domain-containing protein n=1 Tax=Candidatus Leptofilum sp. TaxID=3241576 RepID=UPI003B5BA981